MPISPGVAAVPIITAAQTWNWQRGGSIRGREIKEGEKGYE